MFVKCIMKQDMHAIEIFEPSLLNIDYFMFVSFFFTPMIPTDNGGKCMCMFVTLCSLPSNTPNEHVVVFWVLLSFLSSFQEQRVSRA